MKTTKFRAWYKNQMWEVHQMEFCKEKSSVFLKHSAGVFAGDDDTDVVFLQWTGLSDINGVDIYDGDIVVYHEEDYPLVVEYNDEMARFECIGQEDVGYTFENFSTSRELRVVGNIYQHKERLDVESDRL